MDAPPIKVTPKLRTLATLFGCDTVEKSRLGDITPLLAAPPLIVRMMPAASANAPGLSIERDVVGMIIGGNGGDRGQVDLDGLLPCTMRREGYASICLFRSVLHRAMSSASAFWSPLALASLTERRAAIRSGRA